MVTARQSAGWKIATQAQDDTRAKGQAIGSATTHFITGYAAAPLLYGHKAKPTLTHGTPSAGFAKKAPSFAEGVAQRFRSPKRILSGIRKHYGASALKPAMALTGVALAGGYMKERLQAAYEHAHEPKTATHHMTDSVVGGGAVGAGVGAAAGLMTRSGGEFAKRTLVGAGVGAAAGGLAGLVRRKEQPKHAEEMGSGGGSAPGGAEGGGETMRVSRNVTAPDWVKKERRRSKTASGIYVYQRDPREVKEEKHPGKPKGPAAVFGTRLSPRHALHRQKQEKAEGWMKENAEFIELGGREGLSQSLQTIVGLGKDPILTRNDAQKLLGERDRIKLLCKEHRHAAKKGELEHNPNTERDLLELLDSFETILQNPKAQAFQVVEK